MKLNLVLSLALVTSGGAAFADTLNSASSSPAVATAFNPAGQFFSNASSDIVNGLNTSSAFNFLSDTGSFAANGNVTANCSTCGANYMANGGKMYTDGTNTPDYVSGLNFVKAAGALQITLLYANSGGNGFAEFGIYDATNNNANANVNHTILQPGLVTNLNNAIGTTYNLAGGSPYAQWGIYVRTCEDGTVSIANCVSNGQSDIVTFYMGSASQESSNFATQDATHQHFALFQAGQNLNQYYAAVEDWAFRASDPNAASNGVEGYGDYNDLIFGVTSSISAVPEPATLSIVGLGLAGLGLLGRKKFTR